MCINNGKRKVHIIDLAKNAGNSVDQIENFSPKISSLFERDGEKTTELWLLIKDKKYFAISPKFGAKPI